MTKQPKDKMLTLRMTKEDYYYLQIASYTTGNTPSKLLRMIMDASINAVKIQIAQGKIKLADFEALLDNKL
jgi:predicted DNA-binding protein